MQTGNMGHNHVREGETLNLNENVFQNGGVLVICGGHGLGKVFHDQPSILHFGKPGEGVVLEEGMFFTIEPMINIGGYKVKILADGWTAVTCDKSLSAQFEHSIGVKKDGYEIFTLSKKKFFFPPYEIR